MLGSARVVNRRLAVALMASLIAVTLGESATAQGPTVPPGEPARFLAKYIGLSPGEIEQAKRGEVVTKVLNSADRDEVALFGIVAVDASREDVMKRVRDLPNFLKSPGRTSFGTFSTPAVPADANAFTVDGSDFDAIKGCRPGDCDVKMATENFEEFKGIDWNAPSARQQLDNIVRGRAAVYVNNYRRGGTAAMVAYVDQKESRSSAEIFKGLLAESPYLFDYVPPFHKYLESYPNGSLPGLTEAIYWSNDKMDRMRPILSLNHVSVYAPPTAPLALVSNKQIYASHYFLGAFTLTTILDKPDAPNGKGVYYIVVQRMRFDHLPGGLLNIRGRVIDRTHDGLKKELAQRKASFEGPG
ncbi:MAG: hypothetical protein JWL61_1772 [Gemmatimonadetes bacterium]|jgi:hypothetical protein|nr:hypothetical protein [Gemmatimonadota bacterium]